MRKEYTDTGTPLTLNRLGEGKRSSRGETITSSLSLLLHAAAAAAVHVAVRDAVMVVFSLSVRVIFAHFAQIDSALLSPLVSQQLHTPLKSNQIIRRCNQVLIDIQIEREIERRYW